MPRASFRSRMGWYLSAELVWVLEYDPLSSVTCSLSALASPHFFCFSAVDSPKSRGNARCGRCLPGGVDGVPGHPGAGTWPVLHWEQLLS